MDARGLLTSLSGLTIPLGAIAITLGAISAVRAALLLEHKLPVRKDRAAEGIALFVCAVCALPAMIMIVGTTRAGSYLLALIAFVQFASAAAGIAAYFSRFCELTEGFAAIAMGIFAVLTGFSIGVFIAPFAVGMGVLANTHSRLERRREPR